MAGFIDFALEPMAQRLAAKGKADVRETPEGNEYKFFYRGENYYVVKCNGAVPEVLANSPILGNEYHPRAIDVYNAMERLLGE